MVESSKSEVSDSVLKYLEQNATENTLGENMPKKLQGVLNNRDEKSQKAYKLLYMRIITLFVSQYIKNDGIPMEIIEGLHIGSIGTALNKENLKAANISCILSCASFKPAFPEDFTYKIMNIKDSLDQEVTSLFEESNDFIHKNLDAGKKILVHW